MEDGGVSQHCSHLVNCGKNLLLLLYGGLGFGAFSKEITPFSFKWLWRFMQEEVALWRRVIASIYGEPNGWKTLKPRGKARWKPWFEIAKNYSFFLRFLNFKANEESRIKFWKDKWVGDRTLEERFPDIFSI